MIDTPRQRRGLLPYLLLIIAAFVADRLTKWWAAGYLAANGPTSFNSLFSLQESYNEGVAFGLFQGIGPLVGWLTIGVVAALFIFLARTPRRQWLLRTGLALIIGGAVGNLIDRVTAGRVLDFIATPLRPGIFNVADVMIYLGLILTLAGSYWPPEERPSD